MKSPESIIGNFSDALRNYSDRVQKIERTDGAKAPQTIRMATNTAVLSMLFPGLLDDEFPLLLIDVSEDCSAEDAILLSDKAIYCSDLPNTRLPYGGLLSESCVKHRETTWLYVNDILFCGLHEGEILLKTVHSLIRAIRSAHQTQYQETIELKPGDSDELPSAPRPDDSGSAPLLAGKYRILKRIGRGAYGLVSLARDVRLDKLVAIKQLTRYAAKNAQSQARFIQEARVLSRLNHPNIAAVYSLDYHDESYYLVMEYLEGGPLQRLINQKGMLRPEEVLPIACDILCGLAEAHRHGIIHRDLKPANILFDCDGRAKITDFGTAYVPLTMGGLSLTTPGATVGTVLYMSPEQVQGEKLDGRSDLYAFGALLYRLLSGADYLDPNACTSMHNAFRQIVRKIPDPIRSYGIDIPQELDDLILRLLAKDRDLRYESADVVRQALVSILATDHPDACGYESSLMRPAITEEAREKYRKLVRLFLADRVIVQRERQVLEQRAVKLGIDHSTAQELEASVVAEQKLPYSMTDILEFEEMLHIFLTDGILQDSEREILSQKAKSYGLEDDVVDNILHIVMQDNHND